MSTARKREEAAQTVPIPTTTLSQEFIENKFETDLSDLDKYAPNVELGGIDFTGGGLSASIRGVSFSDLEKSFEPAVGVAIDGVFMGSNSGVLIDMFDIEQVEILRGPQGTLFGRNTIGGVINIRKARPTGEFGAKLGIRYGSSNRQDYKLSLNVPIIEGILAGKVTALINKDNQFTRNIYSGKHEDGQDVTSIATKLLFTPNDNFEALFSFEYLHDRSEFEGAVNLTLDEAGIVAALSNDPNRVGRTTFCTLFGAIPTVTGGGAGCAAASYDYARANKFKVSFTPPGIPFKSYIDSVFTALEMNWDLGDYRISSITGYKDQDELLDEENTGSPFAGLPFLPFTDQTGLARAVRTQTSWQFSQELRVASNFDGPFNFVAGAYFYKSHYNLDPQVFGVFGGLAQKFETEQTSQSYALFAEANYNMTDKLRFTGGLRYTWDKKHFITNTFDTAGVPFDFPAVQSQVFPSLDYDGDGIPDWPIDERANWSEPTWRAGIDYQFTNDLMAYFMYSRGYRAGGFNGRCATPSACNTPYDPEIVDNFELGFKSDWFDNRLRFNMSAFYLQYDDKQEEVLTPSPNGLATETKVQNAASVTVKGVEMEFQALPADWLNVYGSAGYMRSRYKEYLVFDPAANDFVDVSATARLRSAPKWNFNVGADFMVNVGNSGLVTFNANYKWTDEFFSSPFADPVGDLTGWYREVISAYGQADFSLNYKGPLFGSSAEYNLSLFLKNAFHGGGRIGRVLDAGPFFFGSLQPGRIWGIEFNVAI
ncbi:TonB-dependent receptor [Iodidimonas sp. SYSU 1G8]|uniref:TonB-dependent receptor n=1 Tax=Iodidimonas sp. SYSU 1G8 TaxID=3133967 RepID=UPI0031FF1A18